MASPITFPQREAAAGPSTTASPLTPESRRKLISTTADLANFLSWIPPNSCLYLDLEGFRLGRNGTITFIAVLVYPRNIVRVIDVKELGAAAFTTPSIHGSTLKSKLEDPECPKLLWDVRADADALWGLYGVRLAGVTDVQLVENYARGFAGIGNQRVQTYSPEDDGAYLRGLADAIRLDLRLEGAVWEQLASSKQAMKQQMRQGIDIFSVRPVQEATLQYCVNDVLHLPRLYDTYCARLAPLIPGYAQTIQAEVEKRLSLAFSPDYQSNSPAHVMGPWTYYGLRWQWWLESYGTWTTWDGARWLNIPYI